MVYNSNLPVTYRAQRRKVHTSIDAHVHNELFAILFGKYIWGFYCTTRIMYSIYILLIHNNNIYSQTKYSTLLMHM